ncbi:MAG: alpha/beta fold hydrolase [Xanthomonadales bacterium]|nr:alpha/beta fold hydrolase [Xanthomonadales bacterium]MCP5475258.1 alpha/beta fold hydrolase [Rhodanobacteraceae bacterium]
MTTSAPAADTPENSSSSNPLPLGDWSGSIQYGQSQVPIVLHLQLAAGGLSGTLDYPRHHQFGLPIRELHYYDTHLRFSTRSFGDFRGLWTEDRQRIEGGFGEGESQHPLTLQPGSNCYPSARRPQTPQAPYPYRNEELTVEHPAAPSTLAGTLSLPDSGTIRAVILLITGSGAMDRDQTVFEHKPFWVLADFLSRAGYAVLRLDDRGVGASTGDRSALTMDDELADMSIALDHLRGRADLASLPLGLIGHSMGALTAMRLAARRTDLAFIISLAGPAQPLGPVFAERECQALSATGINPDVIDRHRAFTLALYAHLQNLAFDEPITAAQIELLAQHTGAQRTATVQRQADWIARFNLPWFRSALAQDPADFLTRIQCPFLALGGSQDTQVPSQSSLGVMNALLAQRQHPDFQTIELKALNHLFQTCITGGVEEYAAIEETFAPAAMNQIRDWLDQRTPTAMAADHPWANSRDYP